MSIILSNNYMIHTINMFLNTNELVTMSIVNNITYQYTKQTLIDRKKKMIDDLIRYFYWMDDKKISLYRRYSTLQPNREVLKSPGTIYELNFRKLFSVLPELFEFIVNHNITSLDLGCITSYGGYPVNFTDSSSNLILDKLLLLIKNNSTLTYCNLGLFEYNIDRDALIEIVSSHPKLECISIRANGATTHFHRPPTSLYRKKDGSFVWSHFRPLEDI